MCFDVDRSSEKIAYVDAYLKAAGMFRNFDNSNEDPVFSAVYELDLSTVVPSLSGPKRPQDRVPASEMKSDFQQCLRSKVSHFYLIVDHHFRSTFYSSVVDY